MNEKNFNNEIDRIGIRKIKEMLIEKKEIKIKIYKDAIRTLNGFITIYEKKYPNWGVLKKKQRDREMLKKLVNDIQNEINEIKKKYNGNNSEDFNFMN